MVVDVSVERDSILYEKFLPGNDDTKHENRFFKIILDPSWFSANILMPIVGRPSSLSVDLHSILPWGGKEYLLQTSLIQEMICQFESSLGMTHDDLLLVLEHCRVGTVLNCQNIHGKFSENILFVPSRLYDNGKIEWLQSCGVSHVPLSQSSSEIQAITSVLGRRILPRKPFIIPPCFFSCIQAEILHVLERKELQSSVAKVTEDFRVTCWHKGLGLCRDVNGKGCGSVCAMIECTPKWVNNTWSLNPSCVVDMIVWGEGDCSSDIVKQTLSFLMRIVLKAGDIVLNGSLRSWEDNNEEKLLVENPYAPTLPMINWLKVAYLRPGCVIHTLALAPCDRDCGEYIEDGDMPQPNSSPILVSCHHPQPRLVREHLINGYILADSPGGGKGLLRSIHGSLSALSCSDDNIKTGVKKLLQSYEHPIINFLLDPTVAAE